MTIFKSERGVNTYHIHSLTVVNLVKCSFTCEHIRGVIKNL